MRHARPHPPPRPQSPRRMLAHLLWRRPRRHDRQTGPFDEDPWGWACGFYPGCHPRERTDGVAATFTQARAEFEEAWATFLSNRTEADFAEWRAAQAFTGWKYRMWNTRCRLPTQATDGRSTCFCGAPLTIASVPDHVRSAHMEIA